MLDKVIENNRVCIIGEIVSEFTFSHEVFGEGFYIANVSVNRLSDMVDVIPLMISERLIDVTKDYRGMKIEVAGQFRSYNRHEGVKNKLVLSIFVRELRFLEDDEMPEEQSKSNQIFLDGYVCKPPIYRKTPLGREIADNPQVLMTAYAVRGLDINTSYTIYNLLTEQKMKGVAVVYVGEDLDVLLELCDRIVVLCGGQVSGVVDGRKTNKLEVGALMTRVEGGKADE